ncbi:MAG: hypothetical protein U0271_34335 [Polyangiaceae bacterium]
MSLAGGLCLVLSAACGGSVEQPDGGAGGATGGAGEGGAERGGAGQGGSTASTGGADVGGSGAGGGQPSEVCTSLKSITISNVEFVGAAGDQVWAPGETAEFNVTLTNSGADNFNYPGVGVTADEPGFSSTGNTLFGIFANQSTVVPVSVIADPTVTSGTMVTLTMTVNTINEQCAGLDQVQIDALVE